MRRDMQQQAEALNELASEIVAFTSPSTGKPGGIGPTPCSPGWHYDRHGLAARNGQVVGGCAVKPITKPTQEKLMPTPHEMGLTFDLLISKIKSGEISEKDVEALCSGMRTIVLSISLEELEALGTVIYIADQEEQEEPKEITLARRVVTRIKEKFRT